jgi:hypothetical protein
MPKKSHKKTFYVWVGDDETVRSAVECTCYAKSRAEAVKAGIENHDGCYFQICKITLEVEEQSHATNVPTGIDWGFDEE